MADVFDLVAKITLDSKEYDKSLKNAEKNTSSFGSKITTAVGTGAKVFAGFTAAGTAVAAVTYKLATRAADAADRVDKMSKKIGVSNQTFQELEYILEQSGASVESMQVGMKTLRAAMDGARDGTAKNVEQFEKLGVAVTNSDGTLRSQEEVMWDTMKALQEMDNSTEKAKLATELFGKAGIELMPLLEDEAGSIDDLKQRAHDLGLVMGDEAVEAGVKLGDSIEDVQKSFGAIVTRIGAELMPVVQTAVDFVLDNMPTIQAVMGTVFGAIRTAIGTVVEVLGDVFIPAFEALKTFIMETLAPAISTVWEETILPAFTTAFETISTLWEETLKPALEAIWTYITETLATGLTYAWNNVIVPVFSSAFEAIKSVWDNVLYPVFTSIYNFVTENLLPALSDKWENDVKPTIEAVFTAIKTFWETILFPAIDAIYTYISDTLAPAFKTVFEETIKPTVEKVFKAIETVWEKTLRPAFRAIRTFITENLVPAIKKMSDKFNELKDKYLKPIAEFLVGTFKSAFETVKNFWTEKVVPNLETLHSKLSDFKTQILDKINDFIRKQFVKAFEKIQDVWGTVKEKLDPLWTALKSFWTNTVTPLATFVSETFHAAFKGVADLLVGDAYTAVSKIGGAFKWIWENILKPVGEYVGGAFTTAFSGVQEAMSGLITFITGIFSLNWESAWNSIASVFSSVMDSLIGFAKDPINSIIGIINTVIDGAEAALNAVIGGLNSIHVTIPDWVPLVGGKRFGIHIDPVNWGYITPLAGGGHIGEGERAIVGERGMEYLSVINGQAYVTPVGGRQAKNLDNGVATQNFTFNIYTQPGQNEEQIARSVQRQFVRWEQQRKVAYV